MRSSASWRVRRQEMEVMLCCWRYAISSGKPTMVWMKCWSGSIIGVVGVLGGDVFVVLWDWAAACWRQLQNPYIVVWFYISFPSFVKLESRGKRNKTALNNDGFVCYCSCSRCCCSCKEYYLFKERGATR